MNLLYQVRTESRKKRHKENLMRRADLLRRVRGFFADAGYLEVETPVRIPAPLPEAHIEVIAADSWVLQPSPEICMKRLLAAGHEKIFQICKCFRKAERGRRHLPEMTMLEWYAVGETYRDLMTRCEELVRHIAQGLGVGRTILYRGLTIDLAPPWEKLTVADAFTRHGSLSMPEALAQDRFDTVMGLEIEPRLGLQRPVFLHDYPAERGSLARLKPKDPCLAERFELYIGGLELCNGFSELNDASEQRRRFAAEQALMQARGAPIHRLPEKFLADLSRMPACAGNALGIDRLVMLFTDAAAIDEVVAFTPEEL
jgi:elongation factor P--(R)-beta-lysine ligase